MAPFLLDHPSVHSMFPVDVIERTKLYLTNIKGGLGAYSDSRGNPYIRSEIAQFISNTHKVPPVSPDNIFIQNGARYYCCVFGDIVLIFDYSECVRLILRAIIRGPNDGILCPIPQYPLYSASIALYNGALLGYYLDGRLMYCM